MIAIVLLASLLTSVAYSACVTYYLGTGCQASAQLLVSCAANGVCQPGSGNNTNAFAVSCASATTGSAWNLTTYQNATCPGTGPTVTPGTGNACIDNVLVSYTVDCSTDSPPGCFSSDDFVTMADGSRKSLSDVEVGDEVLATDIDGALFMDTVFRISHDEDKTRMEYVHIKTQSGRELDITSNHFLHLGEECCDLNEMKLAGDVIIGDTVWVVDNEELVSDVIVSISKTTKIGAYNVHTLTGHIVVNGIAASHFTDQTTWEDKNSATYWYNLLHFMSPVISP